MLGYNCLAIGFGKINEELQYCGTILRPANKGHSNQDANFELCVRQFPAGQTTPPPPFPLQDSVLVNQFHLITIQQIILIFIDLIQKPNVCSQFLPVVRESCL